MTITGFVEGLPAPMGSHKAFVTGKNTDNAKAVLVNDNKRTRPWQVSVRRAFRQAYSGKPTRVGVSVVLTFCFPRPKSHYGTGKNADVLKQNAPRHMTVKPDKDKLERAVLDCGTGILWKDDAQVWEGECSKVYSADGRAGMHFSIRFEED